MGAFYVLNPKVFSEKSILTKTLDKIHIKIFILIIQSHFKVFFFLISYLSVKQKTSIEIKSKAHLFLDKNFCFYFIHLGNTIIFCRHTEIFL